MSKINLLSTSALLAIGLTAPLAANAQTTPAADVETQGLDRVIVTAQKQEQEQIEVPINITVANQARLDMLGADDVEEFADFVPGLQVQAQSLNTPSYSLRGVTSDGGRPRVAIFQNGVSIGNPGYAANVAMFDLERIEVVKGPQATLFGQGALVGGVNFIQNRASMSGNEGWLKLDGGDYSYLRMEGGYNFAVDDTLAFRIAGLKKSRDGYVDNAANSPDLMGQDTEALRAAMQWRPLDALRADVIVNWEKDGSTGTEFKSMIFPPANGDLNPFTEAANNINGDQLRDKLGNDREIFSANATVGWKLSDAWTLTSITEYRDISSQEAVDSDGAAFSLLQFASIDNAQVWNEELRFNFDDGGPLTAFFGANWFQLDSSRLLRLSGDEARAQALLAPQIAARAGATVAQVKAGLIQAGVPAILANKFDNIADPLRVSVALLLLQQMMVPLTGLHLEESFSNEDQTSSDIFGDISYKLNDKLTLTGGLRYTRDELYSDSDAYLLRGNAALGGTRNAITGGTTFVAVDRTRQRSYDTDGTLTWRLNAAYRLNDDMNTWLAIGRGRRPDALSSRDCTVAANPTNCDTETQNSGFEIVSEEIFDNVEVGLFGRFLDNRLQLQTSAYYGEYKDFQTSNFDLNEGTFVTKNSGNATQYGVEVEAQFHVTEDVMLFGGYAYNFSEYNDTDDDGNEQEYAGNQFRLSPLNSLSAGAEFNWPIADIGTVFFVPTYTWKDDQFFEDDNDPWEFQEAYGLLDLKLGFDSEDGRWGANIYVENATDEEYLIDAGNTGGTLGIPTTTRGIPRMAGAGVWTKF